MINLPVQDTHNVKIRCKRIRVIDIKIYAKDTNGNLILDEVFREKLENNNNTFDNV